MSKKCKVIIALETIAIIVMIFAIKVLNEPAEESLNSAYVMTDYEYLNAKDYRDIWDYRDNTKGYNKEVDLIWKNSQDMLEALYNGDEAIPEYINIDEKYRSVLDVQQDHDLKDVTVNDDDLIICNVSVADVSLYQDRAIVAFVYDYSISDREGKLKYCNSATYYSPYRLCLEKDGNSSQWFVKNVLIPC